MKMQQLNTKAFILTRPPTTCAWLCHPTTPCGHYVNTQKGGIVLQLQGKLLIWRLSLTTDHHTRLQPAGTLLRGCHCQNSTQLPSQKRAWRSFAPRVFCCTKRLNTMLCSLISTERPCQVGKSHHKAWASAKTAEQVRRQSKEQALMGHMGC